jgi:hypothetical protein
MNDHGRELQTSQNNRPKSVRAKRKPSQSKQQANVDDDKTMSYSREGYGTRKGADGDDGQDSGGDLGNHCCFLGSAAAFETVEQTTKEHEVEQDDMNHLIDVPRFAAWSSLQLSCVCRRSDDLQFASRWRTLLFVTIAERLKPNLRLCGPECRMRVRQEGARLDELRRRPRNEIESFEACSERKPAFSATFDNCDRELGIANDGGVHFPFGRQQFRGNRARDLMALVQQF